MEDKEMQNPVVEPVSAIDVPSDKTEEFLNEVFAVEQSAWPPELQASKEKFRTRLKIFPQGFITLRINEQIKAVTTSQVCDYDPSDKGQYTWDDVTDSGMIEKTHKPSGNALYVVSVGVAADAQRMGLGGKLVEQQKKVAKSLGLDYLFLGARIPGYASYIEKNGELSVEEYLKLKNEKGEPLDPEIRFYQRQGLKSENIIPNFEPDNQSKDYGVVMVWKNDRK